MIFYKKKEITVVCHKHDVNTHYLLEPDKFTLGALSVTYLSILDDLTLSLIVIDPWTFTVVVIFIALPNYYSLKLYIRLPKRILQAESTLLCQPENALISISAQLLWNLLSRLSVFGIKENTFCRKHEAHMLRIVYVIRREHQFFFGLIQTAARTRRTSTPSKSCMIKRLTGGLMIGKQCVK